MMNKEKGDGRIQKLVELGQGKDLKEVRVILDAALIVHEGICLVSSDDESAYFIDEALRQCPAVLLTGLRSTVFSDSSPLWKKPYGGGTILDLKARLEAKEEIGFAVGFEKERGVRIPGRRL